MSKRAGLTLLVLIVVLGAAIRSYQLTARSLWFDEAFSWRLTQFPIPELLARDMADVHPPFYYLALKGWSVVFGSSLLALRSFSVTAAAATIAAAYVFAASVAKSRTAGLLAAAAVAFSGWQIQSASEARMYTLGTALALFSSWALLRAIRSEPQRFFWWLLYTALATAFVYTHYYAFFTLAAQGVFVAGYLLVATRGRVGELMQARRLWYALGAAGLSILIFLPWLPTFIRQNSQVQQAFWIGTIDRWSLPESLYRMWVPRAGYIAHDSWGHIGILFLPLLGTALLLAILVWPRRRSAPPAGGRRTHDGEWLTLLLVVIPFILSITLSLVSQSLYQDRFFVFAHVFILVALALVASRIPWPRAQAGVAAFIIIGLLAGYFNYWRELNIPGKPGVHAAARYIYQDKDNEAPVLVSSPFVYFAVLHYATEDYKAPRLPRLYSPTGELAHFAGAPILLPEDIIDDRIFANTNPVLWVVDTTGFGGTPLSVPAPWKASETKHYPEVFPHQGEVLVTRYIK